MAAQNRLQILVNDEPRPDQARIADTMENSQTIRVTLVGELNLEDLQALPMKFQDHDEFPECDHRTARGEKHRQDSRRPGSWGMPRRLGIASKLKFKARKRGGLAGRLEELGPASGVSTV